MIKYLLLALTWLVVLSVNLVLLFKDGITSVWLWIVLAALSMLPLAERLKIGDFIEFGKKRETRAKNALQKIVNIGNLNVELSTEAAARTFAERWSALPSNQPTLGNGQARQPVKETPTFVLVAKDYMTELLPVLRAVYAALLVRLDNKPFIRSEDADSIVAKVHAADLSTMIRTIRTEAPKFLDFQGSEDNFQHYLDSIEKLSKLLNDIDSKLVPPPSRDEASTILEPVAGATGFFEALSSQGFALLLSLGPRFKN